MPLTRTLLFVFFYAFAPVAATAEEGCFKEHPYLGEPNEALFWTELNKSLQSRPDCQEDANQCNYLVSLDNILKYAHVVWLEDGGICGEILSQETPGYFEGFHLPGGAIEVTFTFDDKTTTAELTPTRTETHEIWAGIANNFGRSLNVPVYLQKELKPAAVEPEWIEVDEAELGFPPDYFFNEGHGAYYCGDGGCDGRTVSAIVAPKDVEAFLDRLGFVAQIG